MKTTTKSPSPALPKVRELILVVFKLVWMFSFPLGKAGMVLVAGEVSMMREGVNGRDVRKQQQL